MLDLAGIRHLSFEIGPRCNLARNHGWCPAHDLVRVREPLAVETIIQSVRDALTAGFTGWVGFHYYNEPTLYQERMRAVMDAVPEARYMLWTNGTGSVPGGFDWVVTTNYAGNGNYPYAPDTRRDNYTSDRRGRVECWRPMIELAFDYAGDAPLCCQDWRGDMKFGSLADEPFAVVAERWLDRALKLTLGCDAPSPCRSCTGPRGRGDYLSAMREKGMPIVSVVIPCYKQAEFLPDAIESALAQTVPVEVIVVDAGSPDDTAEVASRYPVKLVRQDNRGLSGARNAGIAAASSRLILPLDADDMIPPEAVEKMLNAYTGGIVRSHMQTFGDFDRVLTVPAGCTLKHFIAGNRACCASLFPKQAWRDVGGYDDDMREGYEDWDFWTRIVGAGYPVGTVDEPLLRYRKHGHSMIDDTNAKAHEIIPKMRDKWRALGLM